MLICSACGAKAQTSPPSISGAFSGPPQVVFDTAHACEQIDVPDAPARAFRDDRNVVHLMASHYVARAMLGESLDRVKHDCRIVYRSPRDTDPSHFNDNNWLYSFFTFDGRRIAALVHSEYDADQIPGQCATPDTPTNCWWNTVTFAQSNDGGYSFRTPPPPKNLVAALPYTYRLGNRSSAYGYNGPSNIVQAGNFFYALLNDWPYKAQQYGPCLIRTADVFDPASWRAWNGSSFSVRFADPYRETVLRPEDHVCSPVYAGSVGGLVQHAATKTFIATQLTPDGRFGPPGIYLQISRDLIHWSDPKLLARTSELLASDGPGNWTYDYPSVIDPAANDRNFSTVSDTPYLYYVRSDGNHPPYARVLLRRRIALHIDEKAAPASAAR